MPYQPFSFSQKTEYIFTRDLTRALTEQLALHRPAKLFVLASKSRFALVEQALLASSLPYVLCSGCTPNPTAAFVDSCAGQVHAEGCDFLLGVGGGSVIDAAKAIALAAGNPTPGGIWDYVSLSKQPRGPALPVGLVVTIPSTGSECNASAVISSPAREEKQIYTEPTMQPVFSITGPELTYTLPKQPAAAGIADILSHLLEQYLHNDTGVDVSDAMLLGVMKAVVKWGPVALEQPEHYDAKANLLWASYLAMSRVLAVGHSENWISHMAEHPLSAKFPLSHGAGMSILLPAYFSMVAPMDACGRLKRLSAEVFGAPDRPAADLLRAFFTRLGLPATLSQAGISLDQHDLALCAAKAVPWGPMTVTGYEPFGLDQARALLESVR